MHFQNIGGTMLYAWILLFGYLMVGLVFAIRWSRNWWKNDRVFTKYGYPLKLIVLLVPFVAGLIIWPLEPIDSMQEKRQERKKLKQQRLREIRVAEWKKAHLPVLYYNTMHGITAVTKKEWYEPAASKRDVDLRNGFTSEGSPVMAHVFLYYHASAKTAPKDYQTGWLSDFDALKEFATVERKQDLFVPFVSEKRVLFAGQVKLVSEYEEAITIPARSRLARIALESVQVPAEVSA